MGNKVMAAVGRAGRVLRDLAAQLNAYGQVVGTYEDVTLSASAATVLGRDVYEYRLTTAAGGVHADELSMPVLADGRVGERHLITYAAETDAGDTAVASAALVALLSQAALTVSAVTFDTVGEWLLLENRGLKWEVIAATSGVVTAA